MKSLRNYQCTFESYTSNGKKSELNIYKYFFTKPKLIRMEVSKGEKEGTILLYNYNDDKIRLRLNKGLFPFITFTFNSNSKIVSDLRGLNISHSDWGWFIDKHLANLDEFNTNFIKEEFIEGKEILVFELISKDSQKTQNIEKEKIWIDKKENVIVKYQLFDTSGEIVQTSVFRNIILNPNIDDVLFINLSRQ